MADTERRTVVLAGRYRLGRILGTGGMAQVFDGVDERLGRPVAVKILRPELAGDPDLRRRFEAEARAAARLTHPRVVAVYDTGEDQGRAYLVMERLPGDTVATAMASGPVDQAWLVSMALDVLSALAAAHEVGIVHRDVKPGNLLMDGTGRVKVGDFGIAKSVEQSDVGLTRTGILIGTPAYMAPERIDGAAATAQSDLYGLGVVMYEALAGRKPFEGDNPLAVAYAARHIPPPPLETVRPGLPAPLAGVIGRAMAVEPAARWASAAEMADALRRARTGAPGPVEPAATLVPANAGAVAVAGGVPGAEATTVQHGWAEPTAMLGAPPLAAGTPNRRKWLAVALIAGVLVLGVLVASALTGGHPTSRASAVASTTVAPTSTTIDGVGAQLLQAADALGGPGTGLMAPTVADGLRQLAADAPDSRAGPATTLLDQAGAWEQLHLLSGPAYEQAAAALVQAGATPPVTTAPAPAGGKKKGGGGGDGGD